MLDSVVKIDNDHYPQIFLEKCKYAVKKTKIMNIIDEELDPDESDDDDDMSDKSDDEMMMMIICLINLMKKIIKIKILF